MMKYLNKKVEKKIRWIKWLKNVLSVWQKIIVNYEFFLRPNIYLKNWTVNKMKKAPGKHAASKVEFK